MAAPEFTRPTFAAEAIPSDVKTGLFLGNAALDNVVSCVIAMGAEMWATKRRMKVLEALLATKGVTSTMVEQFVPTAAQLKEWDADRDRFIGLTLGPLGDEGFVNISTDFPKR